MTPDELNTIKELLRAQYDTTRELIESIRVELSQVEERLTQKIADSKRESLHDMQLLLDTEVTTRFNLPAEGQEQILRKMPSEDDMDIIDGRLQELEATSKFVEKHRSEIEGLKKAQ